jgi:hypothetical protein
MRSISSIWTPGSVATDSRRARMRFPSWVTFVDENLLDVLPHGLGVCLNDALLRQAAGRHFDQDEVRRQVDRSVSRGCKLAAAKGDPRASQGVRASSGRRGDAPSRRRQLGRRPPRGTRVLSPGADRPHRPRRRAWVTSPRGRRAPLSGSRRIRASCISRAVRGRSGAKRWRSASR